MTSKSAGHLSKYAAKFALCATVAAIMAIAPAAAQTTGSINRGASGLPLPRFVSLKAAKVNMRIGPGSDYKVAYRYLKPGIPMEIIQEYDNWRRVRDADGTTGWIHGSLLSGERTAITSPWRKESSPDDTVILYNTPAAAAGVVAYLEPGVLGHIDSCDGAWCELDVKYSDRTLRGYVNQAELWGAYPDEVIK